MNNLACRYERTPIFLARQKAYFETASGDFVDLRSELNSDQLAQTLRVLFETGLLCENQDLKDEEVLL